MPKKTRATPFILLAILMAIPWQGTEPPPGGGPPYRVYLPIVWHVPEPPRKCVVLNGGSTPVTCSHAHLVGAGCFITGGQQVPACHGLEGVAQVVPSAIGQPIVSTSDWLYGENEPDLTAKTVEQVAATQRQIETTYPQFKYVSCGVSQIGGAEYLRAVWDAYAAQYGTSPRWEALSIHCYGPLYVCQDRIQGVIDLAAELGGLEVWVTEFARPPDPNLPLEQVLAEAQAYMDWLAGNPDVDRYFYFNDAERGDEPWRIGVPLFQFGTDQLSPFGELYAAVLP